MDLAQDEAIRAMLSAYKYSPPAVASPDHSAGEPRALASPAEAPLAKATQPAKSHAAKAKAQGKEAKAKAKATETKAKAKAKDLPSPPPGKGNDARTEISKGKKTSPKAPAGNGSKPMGDMHPPKTGKRAAATASPGGSQADLGAKTKSPKANNENGGSRGAHAEEVSGNVRPAPKLPAPDQGEGEPVPRGAIERVTGPQPVLLMPLFDG